VQRFKQQVKEIVDLLGKESDKFPENKVDILDGFIPSLESQIRAQGKD
jgi:hypothetical protein